RIDRDEVDTHDLGGVSLVHDLRPAAGRRAQINDALAALDEVKLVVEFDQLEGRARAPAFGLSALNIRIVDLALDPLTRAFLAHVFLQHALGQLPLAAWHQDLPVAPAPLGDFLVAHPRAISRIRTPSRKPRS